MAKRPNVETLVADMKQLFNVISTAPDLAVALVATSYLDAALAGLLEHKFVDSQASRELLGTDGALGSFGSRCQVVRALGLVTEVTYRDLQKLGAVRNRIAHTHLALDFSDGDIRKLCTDLSLAKYPRDHRTGKIIKVPELSRAHTARSRFLMMTTYLIEHFLRQAALGVRRHESNGVPDGAAP